MVTRLLELQAAGAVMLLRTDEMGWCRLELVIGEHPSALGADMEMVVIERLVRGLRDEPCGSTVGEIDGDPVRWVMSLSEKHCSIYVADVAGNRRLYFQGAQGNLLGTLDLAVEQRRQWLALLTGW